MHPWVFSFATHELKLKPPCQTGACEESGLVTKGWCKHAYGVILLSIFIRLAVREFGSDGWQIFIYLLIASLNALSKFSTYRRMLFCLSLVKLKLNHIGTCT